MAGRPAKLDHVRDRFLREIASARGLVVAVGALPKQVHPRAPQGIHPKHERLVVELAFLGMVASWEEFLERSLVRFVAGAKTSTGYSPKPKFGIAKNISHAYEIVTGDTKYDPTKHYLKGNDAKWFRTRADFYFSGHTFGVLEPQSLLLQHATAIRNRVAHDSEKCKSDFKRTAIDFLHPPGNKLSQGYAPGNLLMAIATRHFSKSSISKKLTHFEAYAVLLESLARQIVP